MCQNLACDGSKAHEAWPDRHRRRRGPGPGGAPRGGPPPGRPRRPRGRPARQRGRSGHPRGPHGPRHGQGPGAPRRLRRDGRPRGQRLRSVAGRAGLRLRPDLSAPRRPHAPGVDGDRRGQGDRGRSRDHLSRLDLQRPDPRTDVPRDRGRPDADPLHQRLAAPAHDPLPRLPSRLHGRHARDRRGHGRRHDRHRRAVRLRVRRRAVRPPPLPLPRDAACGAHRQGPLRGDDHRPEGAARAGRRAGHGDERLRHQLRRRQRDLRRELDPLPLRARSRSRSSATSWCGSTW